MELPNTVEGLVHVNTLRDDYYTFDQDAYELLGEIAGEGLQIRTEGACPCGRCRYDAESRRFRSGRGAGRI